MELPKKQTIALSKTPIIKVSLTANPSQGRKKGLYA